MFSRVRRDEDGQAAPIVLVALVALAGTAIVFVQGGRMGLLAAEATTGADAAALAALEVIHDELEGVHGIGFIASGKVPPPVEADALAAAREYAARNDTELVDLDIVEEERRRVAVRVRTRSVDELGNPAANDEIRTFRGTARGAGELELAFFGPSDRGCLRPGEVAAIGARIGVSPRADTGLVDCRGADVRNLLPKMHEAVIRIEGVMGAAVQFSSAFRTHDEQIALFTDPFNPYPVAPPGTSMHEAGLAFDASNHGAIASAISSGPADQVQLCQPFPVTDEVHFSHTGHHECGGLQPRPRGGVLRIEASDPRLIDPDRA